MAGRHPEPARVNGDAPDPGGSLEAAVARSETVLVHRTGLEFADGAVDRMLRVLHRPHRRLVRVHIDGGGCYLARSELLGSAMRHGIPAAMLAGDPPGLDREIAAAVEAVDLGGRTPIDDPGVGRWRHWLDGAVVGVRAATGADDTWAHDMGRRHGAVAEATAFLRRRTGRVRREMTRLRERPQR